MAQLGGLNAAAYRGRSDLYRWLRKRHAKLVEMGVGQKDGPTWKAVAAAAAKAGQVNRRGEPPSEDNVRQVWSRVCRDEAAAKASRTKAEAALFPTLRPVPMQRARQQDRAPRVEPAAAPPVVEPPRPFTRQQPLPSNETQTSADEVPEDVRAKLEAVTRQLYGEDRWLGPPPKRKLNGQA